MMPKDGDRFPTCGELPHDVRVARLKVQLEEMRRPQPCRYCGIDLNAMAIAQLHYCDEQRAAIKRAAKGDK